MSVLMTRPEKVSVETRGKKKRSLVSYWLVSPAGLLILVLTLLPLAIAIATSFTSYNQQTLFTGAFQVVGGAQYAAIVVDPAFWWATLRTFVFTGAMVAGSVTASMAVAFLLVKLDSVTRHVITVVLIFVWAMPNVASAQVWNWMFIPGYGVANWVLTQLRIFGNMTGTSWTGNAFLAYLSVWLLVVWQAVPLIALTLYAAQSQVSPEYYEAARLDGASEWRIYWEITLNFLKPTLLLMTILSVIWDFNIFNQIWLITKGGPNQATSTLGIWTFIQAFVNFDIGKGAAIAVVTCVILMASTAYYIRVLIKSGEDDL